ncbi:MAG: hypothetical protein IT256_02020 [Chitinophagaceae bacterium]|nr:hypothetical protein [Chitinophagaceae bacterium]
MKTAPYHCTQSLLYVVVRKGWYSFLQHLSAFEGYRGYYNAAYAANALAALDAAERLPDAQARYANTEVHRTELIALGKDCMAHWQSLKRYTATSFAADTCQARYDEAGAKYYIKARNNNWKAIQSMNVSAANFIATHLAVLLAGNNMPATFGAAYAATSAAFAAKFQQFIASEEQAYNDTVAKATANNEVYNTLITMFKDGQELFKKTEGIRRQFVFDKVLAMLKNQPVPTTENQQQL